jgi:hypothetical protein
MIPLSYAGTPLGAATDDVLVQTSRSVERFWEQFPSVTCTESVTQEKVGKTGKVEYRQQSVFDYLVFMDLRGDDIRVEESRLLQKSAGKPMNLPLAITSGFPTLQLVFHPFYQESYKRWLDGEEILNGKRLLKIRFEHIPGTRSTTGLRLRDRDHPLDLQGTAWVDPESGMVEKMTAGLEAPLEGLNLKAFNVTVVYTPLQFSNVSAGEWLPAIVTIDVETARQHWHNVHEFSNYKRFSVNAKSTVSK